MLNILLMPLAIILGVSPFMQILVVLWNFGRAQSSADAARAGGVPGRRAFAQLALVSAAIGGGCRRRFLAEALRPAVIAFGSRRFPLGLAAGSATAGDVILFGPQLVIHALGHRGKAWSFCLRRWPMTKGVNVAFRSWPARARISSSGCEHPQLRT